MYRLTCATALMLSTALPAMAEGVVNIYSYRQPELIAPLTEAFTEETGIEVNVAYLEKGMVERLQAEGDRSPADMVLTVDISRLSAVVDAGLTMQVTSGGEMRREDIGAPLLHWTSKPWHVAQESVLITCRHMLESFRAKGAAATAAADNLKTFAVVEAAYESAASGTAVKPRAYP